MDKVITVIPPTKELYTKAPVGNTKKRRTAGYARVSTEKDEQFTSYEAQIDYYTKLIKKNPEWDFVSVYTDEGITGTSTKRREGFNEMVSDALSGKIDLIVTKSISRFTRNTVDSLTIIKSVIVSSHRWHGNLSSIVDTTILIELSKLGNWCASTNIAYFLFHLWPIL